MYWFHLNYLTVGNKDASFWQPQRTSPLYCGATLATLHLQKVFLQITHFLPHLRHNSISLSGPGIISDETINMSKIIADTVEMGDVLRHANHIDQSIIPCLLYTTVKLVFQSVFC